jgi:hypothetical protein
MVFTEACLLGFADFAVGVDADVEEEEEDAEDEDEDAEDETMPPDKA